MTYRNTKLLTMMMVTVLATTLSANAASVSFSDTNLDVEGIALDNSGTLLQGVNFVDSLSGNGGNEINTTVNGITFTGAESTTASGTYYTTTNVAATDTDRTSDAVSGDAIYSLVYSAAITGSDSVLLYINLQNLTVGNDYRAQFIFSSGDEKRVAIVISESVSSASLFYGTANGAALVTANFTADNSTQSFSLSPFVNDPRAQVSGFALHDTTVAAAVPTPAALPAGLALLGLAAMRRRRR